MSDIAEATRDQVRRARRTWLGAAFNYASALHVTAWGWPAPPGVLEELEIKARLEHGAYDEIQKLSTARGRTKGKR